MFDVIWTDHDRQLQGEHRAKKEAAAKEKNKDHASKKQQKQQKQQEKRSSLSTKRSSVSSGDSPFSSFFRGHGLKRINTTTTTTTTSDARSANSSRLASPSPLTTSFDGARSSPRSSGAGVRPGEGPGSGAATGKCSGEQGRGAASIEDERSVDLSRHASIFSKCAESDILTTYSTGDSSFLEHRRSKGKGAAPASKLDTQPICENATWPRSTKKLVTSAAAPSSGSLFPGPLVPARPKRPTVRPVNLDTWQTPDLWSAPFENSNSQIQPNIEALTSMLEGSSVEREGQVLDVEGWREEVDTMSGMKLDDVIQALRSIWGIGHQDEENQDPESQKDPTAIEGEEMQWMLWALKHLDLNPERDSSPPHTDEFDNGDDPTLILYDFQEIATYLAATTSSSNIHHATTKQSSNLPSSTKPDTLLVPSLRPSDFPPVTNYSRITTLTLPSLIPAVDIPPLLKSINQALLPSGTLTLLLIDPMPRAGTLGRHMRSWLRTHLLPNIERSFRCANPSTLFPEWLASASLRGKGSTITTTKFYANTASVHVEAQSQTSGCHDHDRMSDDLEMRVKKAEIRSLTGRTLWRMIWGPFVGKGVRMWWDEPVCVEECVELGTIWEYHFIEGVKDAGVA